MGEAMSAPSAVPLISAWPLPVLVSVCALLVLLLVVEVDTMDALGLDAMDRRYLRRIAEHHNGGPVGVETLAAALAESRDTREEVVAPFLIQEGLALRTPRGRMLGERGWRHLGLMPPAAAQAAAQRDLLSGFADQEP